MRKGLLDTLVGLLMLVGIGAAVVLAFQVSGLSINGQGPGYELTATFDNVGDLKVRAPVSIAGVRIGEVTSIVLDHSSYQAMVTLRVAKKHKLPADTEASILTEGLLGSNYISLSPGVDSTHVLKPGDAIMNTHSALILENLVGQFLFKVNGDKK